MFGRVGYFLSSMSRVTLTKRRSNKNAGLKWGLLTKLYPTSGWSWTQSVSFAVWFKTMSVILNTFQSCLIPSTNFWMSSNPLHLKLGLTTKWFLREYAELDSPSSWIGVKWIMLYPDLAATFSLWVHSLKGPRHLLKTVWHWMALSSMSSALSFPRVMIGSTTKYPDAISFPLNLAKKWTDPGISSFKSTKRLELSTTPENELASPSVVQTSCRYLLLSKTWPGGGQFVKTSTSFPTREEPRTNLTVDPRDETECYCHQKQ